MKNLTILIPTYNRQNQLLELLRSIESQGHIGDYLILISDNHSDYDIKELLKQNFSKEFVDNIQVSIWAANTGMATNISIPFMLIKTEWCWVISDDDFITDGALSKVLNDICIHKDVLAIKNSLIGYLPHEDTYISSITEFADYYNDKRRAGEMMYLSMVYNIHNLEPYLSYFSEYSYTNLSFLLPLLFGIINGGKLRLQSFPAINYRDSAEDNWTKKRAIKVALGIRTICDIDFGLDDKTHKKLLKVLVQNIKSFFCYMAIQKYTSKAYRNIVWQNLQPLFKINTPWYKRMGCNLSFKIFQLTNVDVLGSFVNMLVK